MHEWHLHDLALGLSFVPQHTNRMRDAHPEAFVLVPIQGHYYAEHTSCILRQRLHIHIMELLPRSVGLLVVALWIYIMVA